MTGGVRGHRGLGCPQATPWPRRAVPRSRMIVLVVLALALAGCQAAASSVSPRHADVATSHAPAQPGPTGPSRGSPRIMIVGDSMTQGSAGDYTWQYRLYAHLVADGFTPRMVGPYHSLYNNITKTEGNLSYADPNFGHDNDAYWGMTLLREKNAIRGIVASYQPQYLLVVLGLDDLFWYGISQPNMTANLASFIHAAQAARPHIKILLGLIPPDIHTKSSRSFAASVATFNRTIIATASRLSTAGAPIAVVRDGAGLSVTADTWDGTHLNENGEIIVAAAFADVLAARFHLGSAYPRPYPVLPTGPQGHPRLTATPSGTGKVRLSWNQLPGANQYFIYVKDVTQGATQFRKLIWPISPAKDPWTVSLLTSGDSYTFKVQACKGTDCGGFSNPATITAP
jgi:GDSL-like Lipase/Acylhydrolase family